MKLSYGYLLVGFATGFYLLLNFFITLPDGKLHITICNVGQGDATYIVFPDGRDLLLDTGPNTQVISCLGRNMPFWDRAIDMVLLTHPEQDHAGGLTEVLKRYRVRYFLHSRDLPDLKNLAEVKRQIGINGVVDRQIHAGEQIRVGKVTIDVLWPTSPTSSHSVLGATTERINDTSVVALLQYGSFNGFFPGDADTRVQAGFIGSPLADDAIEVLKIPHHGSKTGINQALLDWLKPKVAVISVGKNSFGHPTQDVLTLLANASISVLRTDTIGDVHIVSDGVTWGVKEK